jgi:hypothetical protein
MREAWPFAAVAAAAVAVFFVVRLLLPTGESALPPLPIGPEPPAPVFSVALPATPRATREVDVEEPEIVVVAAARPVSQPIAVARQAPVRKPAAAPKPKPAPAPRPAPPAPAPAPEPEPAPGPVRLLASVQPAAAPNPSHGRTKHGKSAPPGRAEKTKKQEDAEPAVVADVSVAVAVAVAVTENPSPGREKHDKGLPPGQEKKAGSD